MISNSASSKKIRCNGCGHVSFSYRTDGSGYGHCWRKGQCTYFEPATSAPHKPPSRFDATELIKRTLAESVPIAGTLGEVYLQSCCCWDPLNPPDLRFAEIYFADKDADVRIEKCPTILAVIRDESGKVIGFQRIYLNAKGEPLSETFPQLKGRTKKVLGATKGGVIRLHEPTNEVVVGEGVTTTLSAAILSERPGLCFVSAGGLQQAVIPTTVSNVWIAADNDEGGTGQNAARILAERLAGEGRQVAIALPPRAGLDWNDILRGAR